MKINLNAISIRCYSVSAGVKDIFYTAVAALFWDILALPQLPWKDPKLWSNIWHGLNVVLSHASVTLLIVVISVTTVEPTQLEGETCSEWTSCVPLSSCWRLIKDGDSWIPVIETVGLERGRVRGWGAAREEWMQSELMLVEEGGGPLRIEQLFAGLLGVQQAGHLPPSPQSHFTPSFKSSCLSLFFSTQPSLCFSSPAPHFYRSFKFTNPPTPKEHTHTARPLFSPLAYHNRKCRLAILSQLPQY